MDDLLKAPFFLYSTGLIQTTSMLVTIERVFCVPELGKRFMVVEMHSITLWINTSPRILEKEYVIIYTIVGF